jgi:hypothetical protein
MVLIPSPRLQAETPQPNAPAPIFDSVLPALKRQTYVSILLPDKLPELSKKTIFAILEESTPGYSILLESSSDCDRANACFMGLFSASKGVQLSLPEKVQITETVKGRYMGSVCGGSCSPPSIEWIVNGVLYTIQLKLSGNENENKAILVKLAENAIERGSR